MRSAETHNKSVMASSFAAPEESAASASALLSRAWALLVTFSQVTTEVTILSGLSQEKG